MSIEEPRFVIPLVPADPVRIAVAGNSELEAALWESNDRRRRRAALRVADWVRPIDGILAGAAATVDTQLAASPPLSGQDVATLIDDLLRFEDLRPPRLEIGLEGVAGVDEEVNFRPAYELYRPDVSELGVKLQLGATICLRSVHWLDATLTEFAEHLGVLCGPGISMDLVLLGPGGRRTEREGGDGDRLLFAFDAAAAVWTPTERFQIGPGHACMVDARRGYEIESEGVLATVLQVRIPRLMESAVLGVLAGEAWFHPLLRADVPARLDEAFTSYSGSVFDRRGRLAEEVADAFSSVSGERAGALWWRAVRARSPQRLTTVLRQTPEGIRSARVLSPGGALVTDQGDEVQLVLGDRRLVAPRGLALSLARVIDEVVGRDELADASGSSTEDIDRLMTELVAADLADVQDWA